MNRKFAVADGRRIVIDGRVVEGPHVVTLDDDDPQTRSWWRSGVISRMIPKKPKKSEQTTKE